MGRAYKIDISVDGWDEAIGKIKATEAAGDKMASTLTKAGAPAKDLGQSLEQTATKANILNGSMRTLVTTFGAYLGAEAVLGAARMTIDYATALDKAGQAVRTTARGVQELENVAVSSGTKIETMTRAIGELQRRLVMGDDSAVAGMAALKVETRSFLDMRGDEQFFTVARALNDVGNETDQTRIAYQLFRQESQELLPAIRSDVDALRESMRTNTDAQLQDLARLQTEWDKLGLTIKRAMVTAFTGNTDADRHLRDWVNIQNGGLPTLPPNRPLNQPTPLGGARGPSGGPMNDATFWLEAANAERRLNVEHAENVRLMREQEQAAAALERAYVQLHNNAVRGIQDLHREIVRMNESVRDAIAQQMLQNLGARERNLRRRGMDRSGNMLPGDDPIAQMQAAQTEYDQSLRNLRETARPGVDISALEEELFNVFQDKFAAAAEAANQLAVAHTEAAGSGRLAAGGMDVAGRASYSAAEAFASFRGMLLPGSTGNVRQANAVATDARSVGLGGVGMLPTGALTVGTLGSSGPGPVNFQNARAPSFSSSIMVDARGAWFENERAVNDLAIRIQDRISSAFMRNR